MLFGAKLPQNFWAEAIPTAVYFRNHSPTKAVDGMTPFEVWHGEKPQINHLRVFGCISYAHVSMRHKLDSKARKYVLLVYGTETKGYRLYDPEKERILCSCDVVFNKSKIGIQIECEKRFVQINYPVSEDEASTQNTNKTEQNNEKESEEIDLSSEDSGGAAEPELRRSTRERKHPDYYGA